MKFEIAEKSCDSAIRELFKRIPMPGSIKVAFTREPEYFEACKIEGKVNQTIIGIDKDNKLVGMGSRNIKPMYINGKATDFGYLSSLKTVPEIRNGIHLARGFQFFKQLHMDGKAPAYITTIIEDNQKAKYTLTCGKAGMPIYQDMGLYKTYAINLNNRKFFTIKSMPFSIKKGNDTDFTKVINFINKQGKLKQFFPVIKENDFKNGYLKKLSPRDFYIASSGEEIFGVIGKWDQSTFKQNVICGYSGRLKYFRHCINLLLKLAGYNILPPVESEVKMFYTCFICIKNNNPEVLSILLKKIYNDNRKSGYHYFAVGFHEKDSLISAIKYFKKIEYLSRVYLVYWRDNIKIAKNIDTNITPYLELGTL